MKMPEKHDLLAAILAAKEQGIGAILAFAMAYLRGRYNGGAFTKTVIDATMCAIIAWFIRDLLDFAGLSSNLAYITSVDAPRDKCTLSCAINGIHAAFHYLKKNYISGCVMTVPTGW